MYKIDLIALTPSIPTIQKVATIGFFDGLHLGHRHIINCLREAAQARNANTLVISFLRHPLCQISPEKAPSQLCTTDEKVELLRSLNIEECALLHFDADFSQLTAREFMDEILRQRLGVTTLLVGYDHRFGRPQSGEGLAQYQSYGKELGIEVLACDEYGSEEKISSSVVREHLSQGSVETAARLLARPYEISGMVVRGFQNGKSIGYPTANLYLNSAIKVVPARGVYATRVCVAGQWYNAMTNIGCRPTWGNGQQESIETHIFGFNNEIYEQPITLQFIARLREEVRFESITALQAQLAKDALTAQAVLPPLF